MYLLALNCGSSSIKGKLYAVKKDFDLAASISVSNIGAEGDNVKMKISWVGDERDDDEKEIGKGSEVERECELGGADGR